MPKPMELRFSRSDGAAAGIELPWWLRFRIGHKSSVIDAPLGQSARMSLEAKLRFGCDLGAAKRGDRVSATEVSRRSRPYQLLPMLTCFGWASVPECH